MGHRFLRRLDDACLVNRALLDFLHQTAPDSRIVYRSGRGCLRHGSVHAGRSEIADPCATRTALCNPLFRPIRRQKVSQPTQTGAAALGAKVGQIDASSTLSQVQRKFTRLRSQFDDKHFGQLFRRA